MIISDLNRDQPEKISFSVKNITGATVTTGLGVAYAITGNSVDGVGVILPASGTAASLPGFMGIALQDIPVNGYGLVQAFGMVNSILLSNVGTSITITQGDPLIPSAQGGALFSGAPTYANSGGQVVIAMATAGISGASTYISGLLQGL